MSKFLTIGEAAKWLGVSPQTLRRWERERRISPPERTSGNQRRYSLSDLGARVCSENESARRTITYARVSSHDQKDDLERQKQMLEMYCAAKGWEYEVVADLGSGMNYRKKGLKAP